MTAELRFRHSVSPRATWRSWQKMCLRLEVRDFMSHRQNHTIQEILYLFGMVCWRTASFAHASMPRPGTLWNSTSPEKPTLLTTIPGKPSINISFLKARTFQRFRQVVPSESVWKRQDRSLHRFGSSQRHPVVTAWFGN